MYVVILTTQVIHSKASKVLLVLPRDLHSSEE